MSDFQEAIARADCAHRVLSALYHAGFRECVAPAPFSAKADGANDGLAQALSALVPQDAPLPQRLTRDAHADGIVAVLLHDGRSSALEAELVALVHEALASLGATGLAVTLRSLAPARALLLAHGLDEATAARLLESPSVSADSAFGAGERGRDDEAPSSLDEAALAAEADGTLDPARLERVLLGFLGKLRFRTYGTRTPEEVAARLAGRLSRRLPLVALRIQKARAALLELSAIEARPDELLARAAPLLARAGAESALEAVREHARDLERLGVAPARLELSPSFSFREEGRKGSFVESSPALDPSFAIDALGAGTLARGGSFPFRSGRAAVAWIDVGPLAARSAAQAAPAQLLVVPVSKSELAAAHAFAREARRAGLRAELDASGRNLRTSFRAAARRGIPLVAVLGEREVKEGVVFAKHLPREEQRTFPRSSAVSSLASWLAEPEKVRGGAGGAGIAPPEVKRSTP